MLLYFSPVDIVTGLGFTVIFIVIRVYVMLEIRASIANRNCKKAFEGGLVLLLLFVVLKIMHIAGFNLGLAIATAILIISKAFSMSAQKSTIYDYLMLACLIFYPLVGIIRMLHLFDLGPLGDYFVVGVQLILFVALLYRRFISN